ncbi:MAG TPA: MarR family winged helix-turn-helix transcriptional regulator [Acidimicrobiales bacterium]|nr:MarR family winged helix-turn-helix transcriptional regulator [Acidimicrobiales bacterium]
MPAARDRRLYFHLQVAAGRLRAEADRRCLDRAGVTTAQAAALAVIHERPGTSQRALARALGQAEPSITALVRRLVAAGLVDRTADPSDARARALVLSAAGEAARRDAEAAFAAVNERIDAVLTGDEVRDVADALRRLSGLPPGGAGVGP